MYATTKNYDSILLEWNKILEKLSILQKEVEKHVAHSELVAKVTLLDGLLVEKEKTCGDVRTSSAKADK